ncbi:hypothetical protein [uncultured Roseobacter sp.]|uniref:hypothetical protein n=1 Tax=uncultured Roseobacter sp. TaxID=114847 RepID=UPI0026203B68|nr:hypothetical protein [uncultured Roseobacter sp.]
MKRLSLLLICAALPGVADVTSPSGKTVDCYCTDTGGARIELGQTICLQVDGRMFMAQCQMSLNVPMWREVQQGCLSSSLGGSLHGGDHPLQSFAVDPQI